MTEEEKKRIETDPDFILLRRFDFSVEKALKKHPDGLPDGLLAQALGCSIEWVKAQYDAIVEKIKSKMGV